MTETVWVVPCPGLSPVPLIAFSPERLIGASPCSDCIPAIIWWQVTEEGAPVREIDAPPTGSACADLILFRLAQAYTALAMAGNTQAPLPWKA